MIFDESRFMLRCNKKNLSDALAAGCAGPEDRLTEPVWNRPWLLYP